MRSTPFESNRMKEDRNSLNIIRHIDLPHCLFALCLLKNIGKMIDGLF